MSSLLQSPFMQDGIREVVPDVAKVAGELAASSVIQGRRRVRLVPQSGQNYTITGSGSANTINFLIADGQSYADLLSAVLSFKITTYDTTPNQVAGGSVVALDDGAFSVFRRALVSVNSTLQDDIDFLPKKTLMEAYSTLDQSWYDNVGSWMGLWKANTAAYGTDNAGLFVSKYNVADKIPQAAARTQGANGTGAGVSQQFMVPVCMLSSFFRNEMLFPLRNAGQLYLQLNLASATEACVAYATAVQGALAPTAAVQISDLTMELDFVDMHPSYLAMMDELMERPDESGVRWAYDSHLCSAQNLSATSGPQSVVFSKASQNLRAITVGLQPQAGLSLATYPKQSTYPACNFVDIQYRIGSLYFPAFNSIGYARAFADLQNAHGSPASLDKSGIADIVNYTKTTLPGTAWTAAGATDYSDMWLHSYCFDRLKHASLSGVDLDGINSLTSSGSQLVVQINTDVGAIANFGAPVMTAVIRFTRVLEIRGGATRVIG